MARHSLSTIPNPRADVRGLDALADADTLRLVTSVPLGTLPVPAGVERRNGEELGDCIYFESPAQEIPGDNPYVPSFERRRVPADLLHRFVELQTDDGMVAFARQFGSLGLRHSDGEWRPVPEAMEWYQPHIEPLDAWRRLRWEFNGLLILAAFIHDSADLEPPTLDRLAEHGIDTPATVGQLLGLTALPRERWFQLSKHEQKTHAATLLIGRVGTLIRWSGLHPTLSVRRAARVDYLFADSSAFGLSLFGALTLQLLAAATGRGFAMCSGCRTLFVPRRRQAAYGRRRYCRSCGRKVAVRQATADWRERMRAKKANRAKTTKRVTGRRT
jgi:hypothetical protein